MINLYIKTISAALIILFIGTFSFYLMMQDSIKHSAEAMFKLLSDGNIALIEEKLKSSKLSQWERVIQSLGVNAKQRVKILNINQLGLDKSEKKQLKRGGIIYKNGRNQIFLTYGLHNTYAYKSIGQTSKVMRLKVGLTMNQILMDSTALMSELIRDKLAHLPKFEIIDAMKTLSVKYGIPFKLVDLAKTNLTQDELLSLKNNGVYYVRPVRENPIRTFYLSFSSDKALVIGPMTYPYFSLRLFNVQIYLLIGLIMITIISVVIMTWLFSRNISKLVKLSHEYSKGNFGKKIQVRKFSTLNTLHHNIEVMGGDIQKLMDSQKNMAKFVAHEIRTPLYTMQLAGLTIQDAIKSHDMREIEESAQNILKDIDSMNSLVHDFLIYTQSTSSQYPFKFTTVELGAWLGSYIESNISKYSNIVVLNKSNHVNIFISIDEQMFHYALNNLVSNANKFKKSCIYIILEASADNVLIHIDDDGPGLPKEESENIFNAFKSTMKKQDNSYKHLGMGLEIAQNIIHRHNGDIVIGRSKILGGARFTIQLATVDAHNVSAQHVSK